MTEKSHFSDAAEKLALNVSLASFLMIYCFLFLSCLPGLPVIRRR